MRELLGFLFRLLLTLKLLPSSHAESPFTAIPGIFMEEVPANSIFYETVMPLLFEFETPYWNQTNLALPIGGANCSTSQWHENSMCPTKYHLPEMYRRFVDYLFDAQPIVNSFESVNATAQFSNIEFECDILGKHFKDIFIDESVFSVYLSRLKSCQPSISFHEDLQFYRKIPQYNYNISDVYYQMRQGFFQEVWMKVHEERIDAGLWSNALTILSATQFLNYYMEATRWKLALSDCQAGRIPSTLIPTSVFMDSLQGLSDVLDKIDHTLVISPDDLGNYYNAPITDCTFTSDSLIVRLLIPITKPHHSHSLMKVNTGHFWMGSSESLCKIDVDERHPHYLVDNLAKRVYDTNCMPHELCHIPSAKSPGRVNVCLSAHLNKHYWNIIKYCKLTCTPSAPYYSIPGIEPDIITQKVTSDSFLVTKINTKFTQENLGVQPNPQSFDFSISCFKNNKVSSEKLLPQVEVGAVLIRMPCRCRLHYTNASMYELEESSLPCKDDASSKEVVEQKYVVPLHWVKSEKLTDLNKRVKGTPISLKVDRTDLDVKGSPVESFFSEKLTTAQDTNTSGGVKLLLTIYFILLGCMIILLGVIIHKLKIMGISVNPFLFVKRSHEISYRNVQPKSTGILVNDDDT